MCATHTYLLFAKRNSATQTQVLLEHKPIIHKSHGEVSLVEQDTIYYVSTAYYEPKINLCHFLVQTLQYF